MRKQRIGSTDIDLLTIISSDGVKSKTTDSLDISVNFGDLEVESRENLVFGRIASSLQVNSLFLSLDTI